jgi:type IV secretion system protein VirB10
MTEDRETSPSESAVFARAQARRPQVRQPNSPWTLVLGMGGAAVLGLVAFNSLSQARAARAETMLRPASVQAPTPAWSNGLAQLAQAQTTPPAPAPQPTPQVQTTPQPTPVPDGDPSEPHWRAPAVVVDLSEAGGGAAVKAGQAAAPGAVAPGAPPEDNRLNPEERFAARISNSSIDTAHASQMRDLSRVIPQGFVIPAVLETAIDSDLPGAVRAVVSRDVRGFDGAQVLIPRGSKLIGQYRSAAATGQTRAFVIWSRIITPQGVSIEVGSPATDPLGRGGLSGTTDTHFLQRFGSSILLTAITAAGQALATSGSNNTALVIGTAGQANQVASIALQKQIDIPPTIRVPQGAPVQVSVARDLDFSGVAPVR